MTNGDFIRSMTDEDITENLTPGICNLIQHRDPERCQTREHCFHCVIGLAVDEYMRLRMGQFDAFAEELTLDGVADRIEAYKDDYQRGILNERGYSIERMFEAAYKMAYPPHGCRGRQHDSWGTCIDLVHAIEHQQWLDSPKDKREKPRTTNRSFEPVPLGHEPFPKIERVEE